MFHQGSERISEALYRVSLALLAAVHLFPVSADDPPRRRGRKHEASEIWILAAKRRKRRAKMKAGDR